MHIKSIELDGFKSYTHRVEMKDFHSQFNVITGANNTGKSDVLDAVAFVLCGVNLAKNKGDNTRRVLNEQELSSVGMATVTVTLDNSDKRRSPAEYMSDDEIKITRRLQRSSRNTWLINDETVTMGHVATVCSFAQLDKPHYLVSQTRLTEVSNMTPAEMLTLMIQAAGIHDYDNDKKSATQDLAHNEMKLRELADSKRMFNISVIIEAARARLVQTIAGFDNQKTHACENACEKVNSKFSAILSLFIPGARARLAPQQGQTILDGLEVHVAISEGMTEKSLSDLSGGEKMAATLSLLMAMFLVKPGPLYILDNVDDKLDCMLTLKLVEILRSYFKDSQLIVITLKEELAKNADVVFRMSMSYGAPAVNRTVNPKE